MTSHTSSFKKKKCSDNLIEWHFSDLMEGILWAPRKT